MSKRYRLLITAVLVTGLVVLVQRLPLKSIIQAAVTYMQSAGLLGQVVFVAFFMAATLLFFPGFLLFMSAGLLFKFPLALLIALPANVLAAMIAFWTARRLARERVVEWAESHPRFAAVDRATAKAGIKVVVLVRLANIFPFNTLNYVFGLTAVRARDYLIGSILGLAPSAIYFCWMGSKMIDAAELARTGRGSTQAAITFLLVAGLAAGAMIVTLTQMAKRELRKVLQEDVRG